MCVRARVRVRCVNVWNVSVRVRVMSVRLKVRGRL